MVATPPDGADGVNKELCIEFPCACVFAFSGEDWDATTLFYYFFGLFNDDSSSLVDYALGDATAVLEDAVCCVDDAVGVFGGDVSMDNRDFDTFKYHKVRFRILKLRVPILILKVAPDSLLRFLHPSIIALGRVSLFLCILKRGISNFEDGFNLDASIWLFIDAGKLLITSSLDRDELL